MNESTQSIFLTIARAKRLLDDEQIEVLLGLQKLDRLRGRRRSIEVECVREGLLTPAQVRGMLRGVRYYVARKLDRRYGKIAVRRVFITEAQFRQALALQRSEYGRKVLLRLSRILLRDRALTPEQDEVVRAEVVAKAARQPSPRRSRRLGRESGRARDTASSGRR